MICRRACNARIVSECISCKANFLGDDFGMVVRSYLRIHNLAIDLSFHDFGEIIQSFLQATTGDGFFVVGRSRVGVLILGSGG
jgi:hypothetical protein